MKQFLGKIIGAFFGLLFAGPIGAMIGFFIGHLIDRQLANPWNRWIGQSHRGSRSQAQQIFFESTFSVMGYLAKADGRVSQREIQVAENIMQHMQLDPDRRQEAIRLFNAGKQNDFDLDAALSHLLNTCRQEPMLLRMFFEIQLQAAAADGTIRAQQNEVLQRIAQRLGIRWIDFNIFEQIFTQQARAYQQHYQRHQQSPNMRPYASITESYTILGIPETSSNDEVKMAYRKLMKSNHPDKLIAKGLPPEMIKLATEKTQRIQKAYEAIRKVRGM